ELPAKDRQASLAKVHEADARDYLITADLAAYSAESIHRIRLIASTQSTGWRPPIPLHCVHRFRSIAST
ncbi:MAG TPA: hypothetical protein VFD42_09990, partial [Chloroflexota bacterium]|nr:hypothetical protein [Chloroflexota bacterium]